MDAAIDKETSFPHLRRFYQYRSIRNYGGLHMRKPIPGMLKKVPGSDE
jgi:hypothetical protein